MDDKGKLYFLCFLFININLTKCFPVARFDLENMTDIKDEMRYPNGTVIGKYTYFDHEGTPVHVKYFANDMSYGVELKSVKTLDSNNNIMPQFEENKQFKTDNNLFESTLPYPYSNDANEKLKLYDSPNKKGNKQFDYSNKDFDINKEFGIKSARLDKPDYDVFVKNDLQLPKNCKDKVRVYIDKLTRKNRDLRKYNKYNKIPNVCNRW